MLANISILKDKNGIIIDSIAIANNIPSSKITVSQIDKPNEIGNKKEL